MKMRIKEITPLLDMLEIQPNSLTNNGSICPRNLREKDFINCRQDALVLNTCLSLNISNQSVNLQRSKTEISSEVFTGERFMEGNILSENDENEGDVFQCGKCKAQFQILSEFTDHKKHACPSRIATKTSTGKASWQRSTSFQPDCLVPVENSLLVIDNGFDDRLWNNGEHPAEWGSENSQECVKIANEEQDSGGNRIVSFASSPRKPVRSDSNDLGPLPAQLLLLPYSPPHRDETAEVDGGSDGRDPSLVYHAIASPRIPGRRNTLPENGREQAHLASLIGGNGAVVVASAAAPDHVVFASEIPDPGKVVGDTGDAFACCQSTDAVRSSRDVRLSELPRRSGGKVEMERTHQTERDEKTEKMKTRLSCSYCGKAFEKPFNLQQHERVHTGERPFQCIICGRAFTQKSNVRKHMKRHKVWPKGKQTLKLRGPCKDGSDEGDGELLDEIDYSCQYCSSSFKSYAEHKKHLTVHSDIKVYRCIQKSCNETFGDLDEFLFHSKMHSSAEFQCHVCFEVFTDLEDLGVHQYDHDTTGREKMKETVMKLKCKVCHARFKSVDSLKNHLAVDTHHYECIRCKSVFRSERFLRRHLFIHVDTSRSSMFQCRNCEKTFRTQQSLRNHTFVHLKDKPFTCDHCEKQFASKCGLNRHLAVHTECRRSLQNHLGCSGGTFRGKDDLEDHVGPRGSCKLRSSSICPKTDSTLSGLARHAKRNRTKSDKGKQVLRHSARSHTFCSQKQTMEHDCTIAKREPKNRRERGREAVSNIEIVLLCEGTSLDVISADSRQHHGSDVSLAEHAPSESFGLGVLSNRRNKRSPMVCDFPS